jgi:hypothetical protein
MARFPRAIHKTYGNIRLNVRLPSPGQNLGVVEPRIVLPNELDGDSLRIRQLSFALASRTLMNDSEMK